MKKALLSAVAICCFSATPAQEAPVPFRICDAVFISVSSNGAWAAGSTEGIAYLLNSQTGKLTVYDDPEDEINYSVNSVSDCGIAAGSYSSPSVMPSACYITEEKGYVFLPMKDDENIYSGTCMGSSADGSMLAGNMSIKRKWQGVTHNYTQPVVWYRNAQGEYDVYQELPFSEIGFDKKPTQGAWILGVSGDGLILYGRIIDGSGSVYLPVTWERSSATSRDWTYREYGKGFVFNEDKPVPEWPQYLPTEPDATKYYSEEELAAFNAALKLYNDSVAHASLDIPKEERWPYPNYNPNEHEADFFDTSTSDGVERHNKYAEAYNKYVEEGTAYNDSVSLYRERFLDYVSEDKFNITEMVMSENGKYMATKTANNDPVIIDPVTEEVTMINGVSGCFPTAVFNDGTVLIGEKAFIPPLDRVPYVYENGKIISFEDWVRKRSEKAYNELMENFPDGHFGIVCSNHPEGLTFGGFNQTVDYNYVGWVMNLNAYDDLTSGIADNKISEDDINISLNSEYGSIEIAGTDKADVRIYSVNGSCVYSAAGVSGRVSVPSLSHGTYIVEVKSGSSVVRKKMMLM